MEAFSKNGCINVFNGEEDAKEFLKSFKLHSLVFNWDELKQCQAIKLLLSDKAEHIYESMTKENQNNINKPKKRSLRGILPQSYSLSLSTDENTLKASFS